MSATYAEDGYARDGYTRLGGERTAFGGFILAVVSSIAAFLVILGLVYAAGAGHRHQVALAAADCEPSQSPIGLPCTTQQAVLGQYEAIVTPALRQLSADAAAYAADEGHNLAAAEAALTAEVATEQTLDNSMAAVAFTPGNKVTAVALIQTATSDGTPVPSASILFTPQMTVMGNVLVQDDQTLEKLTGEQARSSSLIQLRSFNSRVAAAALAVQTELKLLRKAASTPPTVSQEP
jgi:hypothetical protein